MPRGIYDRSKAKPRAAGVVRKSNFSARTVAESSSSKAEPVSLAFRMTALQFLIDTCNQRNLSVQDAVKLMKQATSMAEGSLL